MDENEKVMENQEETAQVQETNNATVIKTDADAKDALKKAVANENFVWQQLLYWFNFLLLI